MRHCTLSSLSRRPRLRRRPVALSLPAPRLRRRLTPAAPPAASPLARDPREPSRVPVSWELTFKHGTLERIIVPVNGKDQTYWFMRYTVINNSGRDILFTPNFEILAETGVAIPAFKIVPAAVFDKIKSLYNNPFLLSPINIDGKLLQGEDNAKDGVAIFPDLDPDSRNFPLFVMGLSGETSEVTQPHDQKTRHPPENPRTGLQRPRPGHRHRPAVQTHGHQVGHEITGSWISKLADSIPRRCSIPRNELRIRIPPLTTGH